MLKTGSRSGSFRPWRITTLNPSLHSWLGQLLNALDVASKANESTAEAYKLDLKSGGSIVQEGGKDPVSARPYRFPHQLLG